MKSDKLADAIGMIGDDLIHDAHKQSHPKKKNYWKRLSISVAAMLVLAIGVSVISNRLFPTYTPPIGESTDSETSESDTSNPPPIDDTQQGDEPNDSPLLDFLFAHEYLAAEYPQMPAYPTNGSSATYMEDYQTWKDYVNGKKLLFQYSKCDLSYFLSSTISEFLSDENGENKAYSPLNLYIALGMLAEITDGNSRQQILDALGVSDMELLRKQTHALWNAHYLDDGLTTSILASSLWLDDSYQFNGATLQSLADNYYASSFVGDANDTAFQEQLHQWLNAQTGGLLEEEINSLKLSPDTIIALATTIYFQAQWENTFLEQNTSTELFHSTNGDISCEFMQATESDTFYWGENFTAAKKTLANGGNMYFLLPDENHTTDDVLTNPQMMELLLDTKNYENSKRTLIHLSVPKFDITTQTDLSEQMQQLGVTDIFSPNTGDFSPLLYSKEASDATLIVVNKIQHDVRVSIDENGCTATAYTLIDVPNGAMPPSDEVTFCLDRPFIFVVTSSVGLPLFVGIVNTP